MRRKLLVGIGFLILLIFGYFIYGVATTRSHSPSEHISVNNSNLAVSLDYCRPYKKGRKIFGGLVPYNEYWRTGANDATEITFEQEVNFGGQNVDEGRYRLYTIPGEESWTIILNSELGQWGFFEPNHDLDVLAVDVASRELTEVLEQFTMKLTEEEGGANLTIAWDLTEVVIPIRK